MSEKQLETKEGSVESGNSSDSSQSDCEDESVLFPKNQSLELEPITYHFLSKILKKQFQEKFQSSAKIQFHLHKNSLTISFDDDNVLKEIKNWIKKIHYIEFSLSSTRHCNIYPSDCQYIKQELNKRGISVFQKGYKCYIGGQNKSANDFNQAKAIGSTYCFQLIQDNIFKQSYLSSTQRSVFKLIFEKIIKKVKFQNKDIESIDYKFIGKHTSLLKYIVRSKNKITINILPDQVVEAFKKYKPLVFLIGKQKKNIDLKLKNCLFEYKFDKRMKQNYLILAFRRNLQAEDIYQDIQNLIENGCKIEGLRYFQNFTKMKLKNLQSMFYHEFITETYPKNAENIYSVVIKCKVRFEKDDFLKFIEIAKSKSSKSKELNEVPQLKSEKKSKKQQNIIPNISISQINSHSYTKDDLSLFTLGQQIPCNLVQCQKYKQKMQYVQYPIIINSKQFNQKWNSEPKQQSKTLVLKKYPWQAMTIEKLDTIQIMKSTTVEAIEKSAGNKEQFLIGQVKQQMFKTQNKGWSMKPTFLIKKKQ